MSAPTIGRIVTYVDPLGVEHPAIVLARQRHPFAETHLSADGVALHVFRYGRGLSYGAWDVKQDELPPPNKIGAGERSHYKSDTWHWPAREEG